MAGYRRLPPTSAGNGGGNGFVGVVVAGGASGTGDGDAAGALEVCTSWKSTMGSLRITWSPALTTKELAVTV